MLSGVPHLMFTSRVCWIVLKLGVRYQGEIVCQNCLFCMAPITVVATKPYAGWTQNIEALGQHGDSDCYNGSLQISMMTAIA